MNVLIVFAHPERQSLNGGDYVIPTMELKAGLERPNTTGFDLHIKA